MCVNLCKITPAERLTKYKKTIIIELGKCLPERQEFIAFSTRKGLLLMKMRKGISAVLAGVLALAALPVSAMSASAEGAYALGDVDMDGFITGHDAAMVTHALYVDNEALTAEQLRLADVNGDGVVDQSDADWIHENQVYELGQMDKTSQLDVVTVYFQLYCVARSGAGNACSNVKGADLLDSVLDYNDEFSEVCYNLMDVNGDGVLDNTDALTALVDVGFMGAGIQKTIYFEEGRYDLTMDSIPGTVNINVVGPTTANVTLSVY